MKAHAAQVAQLKKELAREVTTVAQELSRLESDKRAVETKIANLHAFHMNQKQTIGAVSTQHALGSYIR
jgi:hypothetical protein